MFDDRQFTAPVYLPYVAIGALGMVLGEYFYQNAVGPFILDSFGLGALHEYGWFARGAAHLSDIVLLLILYRSWAVRV